MTLQALGWRDNFASAFTLYQESGLLPARIISVHKGHFRLTTAAGEGVGHVTGRFRHDTGEDPLRWPVVGDWVAVHPSGPSIHAVLPRTSLFVRQEAGARVGAQPLAANIDTVVIATGLDDDFSLRRIERYLALAWESGATPVIVLTKADLCPDIPVRLAETAAIAPGVAIHAVSTYTGAGLLELAALLLPGQTVALLGSSGVGKSSLLNVWLGAPVQRVTAVRAHDRTGRHTTTHRQLFVLPGGGLVIDTPGMREVQLWHAEEGVEETFADIAAIAAACRFADCTHAGEPGCCIQAALDAGRVAPARLESYRKLQRELDYLARREDPEAMRAEEDRWKAIAKLQRRLKNR